MFAVWVYKELSHQNNIVNVFPQKYRKLQRIGSCLLLHPVILQHLAGQTASLECDCLSFHRQHHPTQTKQNSGETYQSLMPIVSDSETL